MDDFKAHEDHYSLDDSANSLDPKIQERARLHGSGGEWRVEKQRLRWEILEAYAKAAIQTGIPATEDFNGGDNSGAGYFDVNQRSGWRWNTSKAFLRPIKKRPNLEIWTHAQVTKLNLITDADGQKRCTSVEIRAEGSKPYCGGWIGGATEPLAPLAALKFCSFLALVVQHIWLV